jgi:hypothetical protein
VGADQVELPRRERRGQFVAHGGDPVAKTVRDGEGREPLDRH